MLDRNQGGLTSRPSDLSLEVIIDCVGGQEIEDRAREAMGHRGHFVTIMGPGTGAFGDGGDGAKAQAAQAASQAPLSPESSLSRRVLI